MVFEIRYNKPQKKGWLVRLHTFYLTYNFTIFAGLLTVHVQYNFPGQRRHHMAIGRLARVHLQCQEKRLVFDLCIITIIGLRLITIYDKILAIMRACLEEDKSAREREQAEHLILIASTRTCP